MRSEGLSNFPEITQRVSKEAWIQCTGFPRFHPDYALAVEEKGRTLERASSIWCWSQVVARLISYNNGQFPSSPGLSYLTCEMGTLMSALPRVTDRRATCGLDQGTARRFPGVNLDCSSYLLVLLQAAWGSCGPKHSTWGPYGEDDRGCASVGFIFAHTQAHTGVVGVGLWPPLPTDLQPSLPRTSPRPSSPCPPLCAQSSPLTLTMTRSWRSSSITSPTAAPQPTASSGRCFSPARGYSRFAVGSGRKV